MTDTVKQLLETGLGGFLNETKAIIFHEPNDGVYGCTLELKKPVGEADSVFATADSEFAAGLAALRAVADLVGVDKYGESPDA